MIWLGIVLALVLLLIAGFQYLAWYQRWENRNTVGMAYYGKTLMERRALKKRIRWYVWPVLPLVKVLALGNKQHGTMPGFEYGGGVFGPPKVSSPEVFERAKSYRPRSEDVFVATQMRCGTTWMQQVVYEIVNRGKGDLSDKGHGHLYAVCPWIDAVNSVSLEDAPLVGEKPTRIIKTHLPTRLCPYSEHAKYIYVARHPVSCFASVVDYNRTLLGPFMPDLDKMVEWFCSNRMYWLPWPEHVEGWWQWAQSRQNVLFVHYEEMITDFSAVLECVASFLGYNDLTVDEKQRIATKCSFKYMQENEELFEMSPPNMFSVGDGRFITSGKEARYNDVTPAIRQRILDYCRKALRRSEYPAYLFYRDLAVPPAREPQRLLQPSNI
jgi:hypothetical protein